MHARPDVCVLLCPFVHLSNLPMLSIFAVLPRPDGPPAAPGICRIRRNFGGSNRELVHALHQALDVLGQQGAKRDALCDAAIIRVPLHIIIASPPVIGDERMLRLLINYYYGLY